MAWYDPWDELNHFQEELLGMLNDKIGQIGSYASKIWRAITDEVGGVLDGIKDALFDMGGGIKDYVGDMLNDLIEALDWLMDGLIEGITDAIGGIGNALAGAFDGIFDPIAKVLGDLWGEMTLFYDWIKEVIGGPIGDAASWIGGIWETVSGFLSDQYHLITEFWGDLFVNLYDWISEALEELWTYFIEVVLPVFMDALGWVFDSPPVKWLVALFEEHILGAFRRLADIDTDDLIQWIRDSFGIMRGLAMEIKE